MPLLWLIACAGPTEPASEPPPCPAPAAELRFVQRAADVGLAGRSGTRITAVDFDGDGWTDLSLAPNVDARDDFAADGVRTSWLLRNDHGTFVDVTEASGFRQRRDGDAGRAGNVVAWGDVDNDGDLDAFTGAQNPLGDKDTNELMLNDGDGTFSLGPAGAHRMTDGSAPGAAVLTDVDLDGALDLWLPQGTIDGYPQQDRLFLGDAAGGFRDVTERRGLTTAPWVTYLDLNTARAHSNAWSGAACDVNSDGRPDLLAASYGRAPNHLWLQGDDGSFANHSIASGYAFDLRQDWTDNESARCWCQLHPTDTDCAGVPAPTRIACDEDADAFRWDHESDRQAWRLGGNSGTTVCADVDNDADLDLLTTEIVHWDVGSSSDPSELLLNDGTGRFERPGPEVTGIVPEHTVSAWNDGDITAAAFDADNDGWMDLLIASTDYEGTRARLYRQVSPGRFELLPRELLDAPRAHGVAVADFDRDGDVDVVVGTSLNRCAADCPADASVRYFENQAGGRAVQIELVGGAGANRAAIGARVEVRTDATRQTRVVDGGHGHYGLQDDLVQTIGLGSACSAEVTVRWPNAAGSSDTWTLAAGSWRLAPGAQPVLRTAD